MNIFVQSTGAIYNGLMTLLEYGYAGGNRGMNPEGVNAPEFQFVPCVGPLPCGFYKIGEPYNHETCGKYFLPLYPSPVNRMEGRGGFGIHGDRIDLVERRAASDGCIIASRATREAIGKNLGVDNELQVVATDPFATNVASGAGGGEEVPNAG